MPLLILEDGPHPRNSKYSANMKGDLLCTDSDEDIC